MEAYATMYFSLPCGYRMEHLSIALTMSVFPFAIIIHHHYCSFSRTLEEPDLGNGLFDHCATAVQAEWTHMTQVLQHRQVSLKVQRNAISREAAQPWLQDFVVPEWKQDIQMHVSTHNAHILASLHRACPQQPTQPKKSFITEEIWQLRQDKLQSGKT